MTAPPSAGTKGLVIDHSVTLAPGAKVPVFRCPVATCLKPCVTLRAFKMHAKCVHKGADQDKLQPTNEEIYAQCICKVTLPYFVDYTKMN